jgi:hydroxyethylthiazole kinase-like uncharacterized protein yjeF
MQKITSAHSQPLFDVSATRRIEQLAASQLPPETLMQRAGLAVARLAMAIAPHAQCIWIACGPGNNGGDGFEAAMHLHNWGKRVVVTWTGAGARGLPPDAAGAHVRAAAAGIVFADQPPSDVDLCLDALLGIGASIDPAREGSARILRWLQVMRDSAKPCLAVDLPSGLNADTGAMSAMHSGASSADHKGVRSRFTLSLLTLKPGLFTCEGRDNAGEVWFDDLGVDKSPHQPPGAWLLGADRVSPLTRSNALHASHKGSFGDVAVIGGESTPDSHMSGAALLAARAALTDGAGRVFVALLPDRQTTELQVDGVQPELMFRSLQALDMRHQVVVCGCGGGASVRAVLHTVLSTATALVLDADALNAVANDTSLQTLLKARAARGYATVLTPHPLEAARLLQTTTTNVQSDRLSAALQLAQSYQAVVVLKGSGSVIAAPGHTSHINSSGNALLATAGTGDVLAGMIGAAMAYGLSAFDAACSAVFKHGSAADEWLKTHPNEALTASKLVALT